MHFSIRIIALTLGVVGAISALIINIIYSTGRHINNIVFNGDATSNGFVGLLLVLAGLIGAVLTPILPVVGAVLMAIAGIGFFAIVGWWALVVASPLLLIAAVLAYSARRDTSSTNPATHATPPYTH